MLLNGLALFMSWLVISSISMEPNQKMSRDDGKILDNPETYKSLIGKLMCLTITGTDIFSVKGTIGQGLLYSLVPNLYLKAFADADFGACSDTRRSVSGYNVFLGDSVISWKSKKQDNVSRSSKEVDYRSMSLAVCEFIWLRSLLQDLHITTKTPRVLYCDNQATIHIGNNSIFHKGIQHVERYCHTVRDRNIEGTIKLFQVHSDCQIDDLLSKPFYPRQFRNLLVN